MKRLAGADFRVRPEHAPVLLDGLCDRPPLLNGQRNRLFKRDVFSGFGRRDGHVGMPEVRRGNHDRIYVLAGEHLAEIPDHRAPFVGAGAHLVGVARLHRLPSQIHAPGVHIAHGHDLHVLRPQEPRQIGVKDLPPGSDHSQIDPAVGGHMVAKAEH